MLENHKNSLTATHLLEYLYCPRFSYFEHVLDIPEYQEKRFKVEKGRTIHEVARDRNPEYLRKKIGVKEKQTDVRDKSKSVFWFGQDGVRFKLVFR
jgi:CRISPR-associated exonuclease Cas4